MINPVINFHISQMLGKDFFYGFLRAYLPYLVNIACVELWEGLDCFTKTARFSMLLLSFLDFERSLSYFALATYFTILHF